MLFGSSVILIVVAIAVVIDVQVVSTTDENVGEIELAHGGVLLGVERRLDLVGDLGFGMFWAFLGVHYGEPPTGPRRFAPPIRKAPWSGAMTAARSGPMCPSTAVPAELTDFPNFAGPEDCLTLDIYVPYNATPNIRTSGVAASPQSNATTTPASLPTIVYMVGDDPEAESFAYGPVLSVYSDVIVVVVRHRVGVLGYLSTGSDDSPGNLGLLDQRLALEWVQDNIALFGGDLISVTIAGGDQSYVTLHLYASPPSATTSADQQQLLFQRLIADDGAATTPRFLPDEPPVSATYDVATRLGCPDTSNDSALIDCLRNTTIDELLGAASEMRSTLASSPWKPYLDGQMLSSNATDYLKNGSARNVDVMVGYTTQDGTVLLPSHVTEFSSDNSSETLETWNFVEQLSSPYLTNVAPRLVNTSLLRTLVRQQYIDWTIPDTQDGLPTSVSSEVATDVAADLSVVIPTSDFINDMKSQTSTYNVFLFDLDKISNSNATSIWTYIFGLPIEESNRAEFDDGQRQLATKLLEYSSNFLRTGDTNTNSSSDAAGVPPEWPQYDQSGHLLVLRATNTSEERVNRAESVAFWTVTVPEVGDFLENIIKEYSDTSGPSKNGTSPSGGACDNTTAGSGMDPFCSNTSNMTTPNVTYPSTESTVTNITAGPDTTMPRVVVVGRKTLRWTLTPDQASIALQVLLGFVIGFACLLIILAIVLVRTRSELRRNQAESSTLNRRGAPMKKSIRGSGSRWLWRPRDPDDDFVDNAEPFESRGITLGLKESTSLERLDTIKTGF